MFLSVVRDGHNHVDTNESLNAKHLALLKQVMSALLADLNHSDDELMALLPSIDGLNIDDELSRPHQLQLQKLLISLMVEDRSDKVIFAINAYKVFLKGMFDFYIQDDLIDTFINTLHEKAQKRRSPSNISDFTVLRNDAIEDARQLGIIGRDNCGNYAHTIQLTSGALVTVFPLSSDLNQDRFMLTKKLYDHICKINSECSEEESQDVLRKCRDKIAVLTAAITAMYILDEGSLTRSQTLHASYSDNRNILMRLFNKTTTTSTLVMEVKTFMQSIDMLRLSQQL